MMNRHFSLNITGMSDLSIVPYAMGEEGREADRHLDATLSMPRQYWSGTRLSLHLSCQVNREKWKSCVVSVFFSRSPSGLRVGRGEEELAFLASSCFRVCVCTHHALCPPSTCKFNLCSFDKSKKWSIVPSASSTGC